MNAWEKRTDESSEAYAALTTYFELGSGRSIADAYRTVKGLQRGSKEAPAQVPGSWKRWARRFEWVARADAYDRRLATEAHAGAEQAARSKAAAGAEEWFDRFTMNREQEWSLSQRCFSAADRLLDEMKPAVPGAQPQSTAGPAKKPRVDDIVNLVEAGSKFGRLACGLADDRSGVQPLAKPVEEMTDEEITTYLRASARTGESRQRH